MAQRNGLANDMSKFTQDWFTPNIPRIEPFFPVEARRLLEIGCFEGRSTLWFLSKAPHAVITCIDHFRGGSDHKNLDLVGLEARFLENTFDERDRIWVLAGDSWSQCLKLNADRFDFVYVDGSHEACDVLHDAVQAFRVVRTGGIIVFDDYGWGVAGQSRPKEAIDAFLLCFKDKIEVLLKDYVVIVQRLC